MHDLLELDALGDELNFEEEEMPSYLQDDTATEELPKAAETDPKQVIYFTSFSHLYMDLSSF